MKCQLNIIEIPLIFLNQHMSISSTSWCFMYFSSSMLSERFCVDQSVCRQVQAVRTLLRYCRRPCLNTSALVREMAGFISVLSDMQIYVFYMSLTMDMSSKEECFTPIVVSLLLVLASTDCD